MDLSKKEKSEEGKDKQRESVDMSKYKDHFALRGKNKGCSAQFLGKVCLVGFLVHDRSSAWTEEDIQTMKNVLKHAAEMIKEQSGLSDHRLKISYAFDDVPVQYRYEREEYQRVAHDILEQYGYERAAAYQAHYEKKFKKDEAPLIFFINRDFRAFALEDVSETLNSDVDEYCFVSYSNDADDCVRTLIHEVMHQFGAIDYYIPESVKEVAQKIFPESVMLHGFQIDPLTRYLIGWDEEPSDDALQFLDETAEVTMEEIAKAREKDRDNDW